MNTRQIQPKAIFTQNGEKNATIFTIYNMNNYHFDNGICVVNFKLLGMEGDPESAIEYYRGDSVIPADIVSQWGTDDNIIFDYVASQLGLTIINN